MPSREEEGAAPTVHVRPGEVRGKDESLTVRLLIMTIADVPPGSPYATHEGTWTGRRSTRCSERACQTPERCGVDRRPLPEDRTSGL